MIKASKLLASALITACIIAFPGCKDDFENPARNSKPSILTPVSGTKSDSAEVYAVPPTVITADVTLITSASAVSGGIITDDGGGDIITKGISWSITPDYYIYDNDTAIYSNGPGSGSFVSYITKLAPGKTYYVKAFAVNAAGISFGATISFTTGAVAGTIPDPGILQDIDGNLYKTVRIGNQVWMAENLRAKRYNDGSAIPVVADNTDWSNLSGGAYSTYNNDPSLLESYGVLYNWYAVSEEKNVCPAGWHVPSRSDMTELMTYLGGSATAGGKLKEEGTFHWSSPNTGADNSSGWMGLPGGIRRDDGLFVNMNFAGIWWTTTISDDGGLPVAGYLNADINNFYLPDYLPLNTGCSIRCIRNY